MSRARILPLLTLLLAAVLAVAGCTHPQPVPPGPSATAPATSEPAPWPTPTGTTTTPPATTTETAPPTTTPTAVPPPPPGKGDCVVPAGMTKLFDQDSSDEQLPWKLGPNETHLTVWWNVTPLDSAAKSAGWTDAEAISYAQSGADLWSTSPCIEGHVVQTEYPGTTKCPSGVHCIPITVNDGGGDDGNTDAVEKGGYSTAMVIQVLRTLSGSNVTLADGSTCNERKNVFQHEMGHSIGLVHRKMRVLMDGPTFNNICGFVGDDNGHGGAHELDNLAFDYGRQIPNPRAAALAPVFRHRAHGH